MFVAYDLFALCYHHVENKLIVRFIPRTQNFLYNVITVDVFSKNSDIIFHVANYDLKMSFIGDHFNDLLDASRSVLVSAYLNRVWPELVQNVSHLLRIASLNDFLRQIVAKRVVHELYKDRKYLPKDAFIKFFVLLFQLFLQEATSCLVFSKLNWVSTQLYHLLKSRLWSLKGGRIEQVLDMEFLSKLAEGWGIGRHSLSWEQRLWLQGRSSLLCAYDYRVWLQVLLLQLLLHRPCLFLRLHFLFNSFLWHFFSAFLLPLGKLVVVHLLHEHAGKGALFNLYLRLLLFKLAKVYLELLSTVQLPDLFKLLIFLKQKGSGTLSFAGWFLFLLLDLVQKIFNLVVVSFGILEERAEIRRFTSSVVNLSAFTFYIFTCRLVSYGWEATSASAITSTIKVSRDFSDLFINRWVVSFFEQLVRVFPARFVLALLRHVQLARILWG